MSNIGLKGYISTPFLAIPGVVVSEPVQVVAKTQSGREFPAFRADVISLRETNPANGPVRRYLRKTNEDLGFYFPREETIVGLDATEDGEKLSVGALGHLAMQDTMAFQASRLAARADAEVVIDDIDLD